MEEDWYFVCVFVCVGCSPTEDQERLGYHSPTKERETEREREGSPGDTLRQEGMRCTGNREIPSVLVGESVRVCITVGIMN